jgi:hypothetical protein
MVVPLQNLNLSSLIKLSKRDITMRLRLSIAFIATTAWPSVLGWTTLNNQSCRDGNLANPSLSVKKKTKASILGTTTSLSNGSYDPNVSDRRALLAIFASASFAMASLTTSPAVAADVLKPQEFKNVGTQAPAPDGDSPFVTLDNGVKIKDFRVGSGESSVTPSSRVTIQCSGRLLNLNGVVFYNTKNNNPDGFGAIPLKIEMGIGESVPGLEAGLIGMKKGGIRRIIVPQDLAYNKYPDLEPKPMNTNDQRALDSVVKNPRRDGAILFDVQVERVK